MTHAWSAKHTQRRFFRFDIQLRKVRGGENGKHREKREICQEAHDGAAVAEVPSGDMEGSQIGRLNTTQQPELRQLRR